MQRKKEEEDKGKRKFGSKNMK